MNPTQRFSDRVADYVKYRPHYPKSVVTHLIEQGILFEGCRIADIGSGTGFLTEIFLQEGYNVFGVEPSKEMREMGEIYLKKYNNFYSVDGTAEKTSLKDNSIDIITIGQAFHWFRQDRAKDEFRRIGVSGAYAVIVYNSRKIGGDPFTDGYEHILRNFCPDYLKSSPYYHSDYAFFYFPHKYSTVEFEHFQEFNFQGLKGRLASSSYSLKENYPDYPQMISGLKSLFDQNQIDGKIRFKYTTEIISGKIN